MKIPLDWAWTHLGQEKEMHADLQRAATCKVNMRVTYMNEFLS